MYINEITTFLGWCTVINIAIYAFSALFIIVFKNFTITLQSKLIDIDAEELPTLYFKYLANFKLAVIIFNLTPYIALRLMT